MRYLIDGYNLMYWQLAGSLPHHALGVMVPRFGPDGLRRARHRFLNDLAAALGPLEASAATVVFDAARAPEDAARESRHKGMAVVFAVDAEDADERIEQLLARHSNPKALTVVSSDRRLRDAARRRGARPSTADEFATFLASRRSRPSKARPEPSDDAERLRQRGPSAGEARLWLDVFGDLDAELADDRARSNSGLTDEEIRRLEREVEGEDV